ncbi:methylenetetrahydrofolate reductase C-terminal domain-containing protein [bacterium]|nr:methylenetetrahydrofolate reductase C-terminal domain-containing protein [bacterium]
MSTLAPISRVRRFFQDRSRLTGLLDRLLRPVERLTKGPVFGCRMCGQCVLHSTGMVCPMTCPKNIRNGPCGGVRQDSSCEVDPDRKCIWVTAHTWSQHLVWADEFHDLRPPVDWSLRGTSSWMNHLSGHDRVVSGCAREPRSALEVVTDHGP